MYKHTYINSKKQKTPSTPRTAAKKPYLWCAEELPLRSQRSSDEALERRPEDHRKIFRLN